MHTIIVLLLTVCKCLLVKTKTNKTNDELLTEVYLFGFWFFPFGLIPSFPPSHWFIFFNPPPPFSRLSLLSFGPLIPSLRERTQRRPESEPNPLKPFLSTCQHPGSSWPQPSTKTPPHYHRCPLVVFWFFLVVLFCFFVPILQHSHTSHAYLFTFFSFVLEGGRRLFLNFMVGGSLWKGKLGLGCLSIYLILCGSRGVSLGGGGPVLNS